MNSLSVVTSKICEPFPTFHLNNPQTILKTVTAVALPVFALFALASLPTAIAGGTEFQNCVDTCVQGGQNYLTCAAICSWLLTV
ncbi:MAG: hypothetical protein K1000chlam3_01583 [Chlamydiae bacterium]|nr:hypothetical protein [Chlamydiota bacterium]